MTSYSRTGPARSAEFAKGMHLIDDDDLAWLLQRDSEVLEVARLIKETMDGGHYTPPMLPEVAVALTQMASRPDVDFAQVEKTVSGDPVVAAKMVAVANSAYYSRGQPVRSLGAAIARLGLAAVRDVAFQVVAQTTIFKTSAYAGRMRTLYRAAQLGGLLAKELCVRLKFASDMAYLCGLLHDMGEAIILGIVAADAKRRKVQPPSLGVLEKAIAALHSQVGARLCAAWDLPPVLVDALLFHHKADDAQDPTQMAQVIAVVDLLLRHVGVGVAKQPVDPMAEPAFYRLNMTPDQVSDMLAFTEDLVCQEDL